MRTTIDPAGRLVVPKQIRVEAGLRPGMALEIRCRDGRIEIEPAPQSIKLVREGPFLVAVPETDLPTMEGDIVEQTRDAIEQERIAQITGLA